MEKEAEKHLQLINKKEQETIKNSENNLREEIEEKLYILNQE